LFEVSQFPLFGKRGRVGKAAKRLPKAVQSLPPTDIRILGHPLKD